MEITDEMAKRLQKIYPEKISVQKAKKKLLKAYENGCPLLDDCTKCEKVRACPIIRLDDQSNLNQTIQ